MRHIGKTPRNFRGAFSPNGKEENGIEFARVYELGNWPNGKGGKYVVYSGTVNSVTIPITNKTILINHTHPGGTASPSNKDMKLMELLSQVGSPQKTSGIVPIGKKPIKFTKEGAKK